MDIDTNDHISIFFVHTLFVTQVSPVVEPIKTV